MNEWMGMLIKYNSTDNNTPSTSSHSLPPSKWQRRTPHICQRTENGKRMKPKSAAAEEKNRAIFQFNLSQSDSWNISLSKCLIYPKGVIRYNIPLRFIYLVLDYDIPLFSATTSTCTHTLNILIAETCSYSFLHILRYNNKITILFDSTFTYQRKWGNAGMLAMKMRLCGCPGYECRGFSLPAQPTHMARGRRWCSAIVCGCVCVMCLWLK